MQRNLLHYQRALFLRKSKGYSYNEILVEVPVAKSTLSYWLRGIELGASQKKRIRQKQIERWGQNHHLGEWNRKKRQKEVTAIRVQAKKEVSSLTNRELFVSGIMLYWAEGSKRSDSLQICNADPSMIKFMMYWFRSVLNISEDRFTGSIHYHKGQSEALIKEFWSKLTGIPLTQFTKSFQKPPGTGHRKHYLQWGVFRIRIRRSADLLHKVCAWKDGLISEKI